jgi:serine/threonine protein kinase
MRRAEIPKELEKIVRRAMAKDPEDRYRSAADLVADLNAYQAGTQLSQQTRVGPRKVANTSTPSTTRRTVL